MDRKKHCEICGQVFAKPPGSSLKQWQARRFCSKLCANSRHRRERRICSCGCGEEVKGVRSRYRPGHNPVDERGAPLREGPWRVGLFNNKPRWYRNVKIGGKSKKILRSREVMEGFLGRKLEAGEVVDHVDRDSLNDDPSNLRLWCSQSEHLRHHIANGEVATFTSERQPPR